MATKYYMDEEGNYLGGWVEPAVPPDGSTEIPSLPLDARMKWDSDLQDWYYSNEIKWEDIREERDRRLIEIEWRVTRFKTQSDLGVDTTDSSETYNLILQYMQDLRDLTEDFEDPNDVDWPTPPAEA